MTGKKTTNIVKTPNQKSKNFVTDDGNVYILGEFDSTISTEVIYALVSLTEQLAHIKNPTIHIYINSYGGDASELFSLLSILDDAKKKNITIYTHVIGVAYSAGSILAAYGDYRTMSRYSDHLLHLGCAGAEFSAFEQLKREAENNVKHFNKILQIYSEHTKIPKKKLTEMLKDDKLYLDADQCLKYGICDEIV
jgi:ATP-dependent protease ClpP protease subunit